LTSCALFGGHKGKSEGGASAAEKVAPLTTKDYEMELRGIVAGRIEAAGRSVDEQRNKVIRRNPYLYKEYSVYPDGANNLKVILQEKEARSTPYIADVTVAKQRFSTRLHRKRGEAENDSNFLRDTGTETVTYELRNHKWMRVGSLFVAQKTEENVNGEWVPIKETAKRTVPAEEEKARGWFKRTWSKITGRDEEQGAKPKEVKSPERSPTFGPPRLAPKR
jgi:hypothetical protein